MIQNTLGPERASVGKEQNGEQERMQGRGEKQEEEKRTTNVQYPSDDFVPTNATEEGESGPEGTKMLASDADDEHMGVR